MNTKREAAPPAEAVDLEPLMRDDGRPPFADSWEAEAFAIGKVLLAGGAITPREWYDEMSRAILRAQESGDPDRGDTYYRHWMDALERLCVAKGLFDRETLMTNTRLWSLAVANTPHGVPIELENAFCPPSSPHDHDHDHDAEEAPRPIAVHPRECREPEEDENRRSDR